MKVPEYTLSLLFFLAPILLILGFFGKRRILRSAQKKAILFNVAVLASVGIVLDLAFASQFFTFPDRTRTLGIAFEGIPIEEFVFYISGFWFILLLYVFGDEYFLRKYNRPDHHYAKFAARLRKRLYLSFSPKLFISLALLLAGLAALKAWLNPSAWILPGYFVFLLFGAYTPYFLFWRITRRFVNFQALVFAVTLTTLISVIWEVTLALPRGYWGYRPEPMLGIFLPAWSNLPIEAVTVWIFSSLIILTYEYTKIAVFRLRHRA